MPTLQVTHDEGRRAFLEALDGFVAAVEPLDDHALLAASRCWGWAVVDVVTHVRSGLDEVAAALLGVGSAPRRPDRDAATYWSEPPPGGSDDPVAGIVAIRRLGSASRRPVGAVAQLVAVAAALRTGVDRVEDATLGFQGRVLTTGDFLATWAVELAVHQLDLARDLEVAPPPARALALARRTVETLLGDRLPGDDDAEAVLLATGRRAATADELRTLGAGAERLPLL